jgi:hypothetical protein
MKAPNPIAGTSDRAWVATSPESRSRRHGWRAGLVRAVSALLLALALPLTLGTSGAQAMIIGGCGNMCDIYNPVFTGRPADAVIAVQCGPGRITIDPHVTVQAGYTRGQYITYRYHVTNSRGHAGTSGWSAATFVPYVGTTNTGRTLYYPFGALPGTRWGGLAPATWNVWVQLGYWNGSSYSYSSWLTPTGGYSRPGSTFTWATCSTA